MNISFKKIILFSSFSLFLISSLEAATMSFSTAKKKLLKNIYYDHQSTFYCSNPYKLKQVKGKEKSLIIKDSKYYSPRKPFYKSGKPNIRAERIEWEHIMPAENFGRQFTCWRNGDAKCINSKGKKYKGRKCCNKVSDKFKAMQSDMHNLVPAIGEVNGDRSNYRYGANKVKKGMYGSCEVQVDFKARRAFVKDEIKGDIARTYLYMSDEYNIKLSKQERKMMEAWNKMDPISKWEKVKNERIYKIQGNKNPYIK